MIQSVPVSTPLAPAHPVRRYGVRVGIALGVMEIVHGLLNAMPPPGVVTAVFFGVAMLSLAYAGAASASITRRMNTGMRAGLLAGVILSTGYAIGYLVSLLLNGAAVRAQYVSVIEQAHLPAQSLMSLMIAGAVMTIALTFIGGACAGAVVGAIGGYIGKRRA